MRRIASHRARARWSTRDRRRAIVVAVWITGARIFAARANRARCAARDGATFAVRCGICVYEYSVALDARAGRGGGVGGRGRRGIDRSIDVNANARLLTCVNCIFARIVGQVCLHDGQG